MGTYLNPSNDKFQRSLNSKIYVDKSELIETPLGNYSFGPAAFTLYISCA